jgi:pyruvate kinase
MNDTDKKNVKIVATIGPATHTENMIFELAKAGVDIFRINLSHAKPVEVPDRIRWIRRAGETLGKKYLIIGDLPGPKIRIDDMIPNTTLKNGQKFTIFKKHINGDQSGCSINYPKVLDPILPGAEVYIDDGNIRLRVDNKTTDGIETTVMFGGSIKSRKGFSGIGIALDSDKISEKDKEGIMVMAAHGADMLAVSFVENEKDMLAVKNLLPHNSSMNLLAKIETINGVKNAEKILEVCDGLMIARGDLGLAVPLAEVPQIQKNLIKLCNEKGKFVITATQMLESMIQKPVPTRAEVSDVYNAVLDGTDAVMLSAETAAGKFPIETVKMMRGIIDEALKYS